jgi:hypothetical protein
MWCRLLILLLTAVLPLSEGKSQGLHSIYIQSANHAPYSIETGGKLIRSSVGGYAVISGLASGLYELSLIFFSDSSSPLCFYCRVNQNDQSFLLRKGKEGWELFNILNGAVVPSGDRPATDPVFRDDNFVNILAELVGTPSLKELNPRARRPVDTVSTASILIMGALPADSFRCLRSASAKDFRQLRRRWRRQKNEEEKIGFALQRMHGNCFTALQIKYLAHSVANESVRFAFVEKAYDYVYDPGRYESLKELFTDPKYLNRFADH